MILRETSPLVLAGVALGAGLAYGASRWITSQLYGVAPQDPATLALAVGVLLVVTLSATYLPAQQAARADPMAALRRE
jgi:ABC-type antimicrobial peptide transport system permease subunit